MKHINGYPNTAHNCQFELDVLVILQYSVDWVWLNCSHRKYSGMQFVVGIMIWACPSFRGTFIE